MAVEVTTWILPLCQLVISEVVLFHCSNPSTSTVCTGGRCFLVQTGKSRKSLGLGVIKGFNGCTHIINGFLPQIFQSSILVNLIGAVLHVNLEKLSGLCRNGLGYFSNINPHRFARATRYCVLWLPWA